MASAASVPFCRSGFTPDTSGIRLRQSYGGQVSLRVTPAMQAGLTDHVWEIKEIIDLLENYSQNAA
jgi:hypothetical protein